MPFLDSTHPFPWLVGIPAPAIPHAPAAAPSFPHAPAAAPLADYPHARPAGAPPIGSGNVPAPAPPALELVGQTWPLPCPLPPGTRHFTVYVEVRVNGTVRPHPVEIVLWGC